MWIFLSGMYATPDTPLSTDSGRSIDSGDEGISEVVIRVHQQEIQENHTIDESEVLCVHYYNGHEL